MVNPIFAIAAAIVFKHRLIIANGDHVKVITARKNESQSAVVSFAPLISDCLISVCCILLLLSIDFVVILVTCRFII